ncbi:MAG: carbohydrate ABC transporter permease [Cyanobacteriota bacterium]
MPHNLRRINVWRWWRRLGVTAVALFYLAPLLWQVLTSFKTNADIAALPLRYWPGHWTLEHYQELFQRRPMLSYFGNSFLVAALSALLSLAIGAPAAYSLSRENLPRRSLWLSLITLTAFFPYMFVFLGLLEWVRAWGLGDTYLALIVPYTAINLPLTILVLRSFFQQLPPDLEDAGRIDGYSPWGVLVKILLPLTLPALVAAGILAFIFAWNEYLLALSFISREALKTIPVATAAIAGSSLFETPYGPIAAATVLGSFPLVILVLFFQRRLTQGLTAGAVKG